LGLQDRLVGRSHECDYPTTVSDLPILTSVNYPHSSGSESLQIHHSITELLQKALSIYDVDDKTLIDLNPDIILTQDHCEVCAVSYDDLSSAVKEALGNSTEIVSASPTSLAEVCQSFVEVADALGVRRRGEELTKSIQSRFDEIQNKTTQLPKPNVVAIEWIDPLMTGGNWMPELLDAAGGRELFGTAGAHSPWTTWEQMRAADPDAIVILPCGFDLERTRSEAASMRELPGWSELTAVREGRVAITDGHRYFNRPGPRLTDSTEILAEILHPGSFAPSHAGSGWEAFEG